MFFEDALIASKELDIALTKRASSGNDTPMCGVPYHVAENYISKLIKKGYKVAICDQIEDPKLAKSIVKREVTKIITPGTFTNDNYLNKEENNYLLSTIIKNNTLYMTYVDYSTGELYTTSKTFIEIIDLVKFFVDECHRINPSEILINKINNKYLNDILKNFKFYINYIEDLESDYTTLKNSNKAYIRNEVLKDIDDLRENNLIGDYSSINVILNYLIKTQKVNLNHLNSIVYYNSDEFLLLDESSKRNLELIRGINTNSKEESLLDVLDKCKTSMGSRELKKWIEEPLQSIERIENRLDIIDSLSLDLLLFDDLRELLKKIYDIERLSVRISNSSVSPKDLICLLNSLDTLDEIKVLLEKSNNNHLLEISNNIDSQVELRNKIRDLIIDDPPANYEEKQFIRKGYSEELDKLFEISTKGKNWILEFEEKERKNTGIKNLKVKYNKILGYFIEVTKSFTDKVPNSYIRKQTLVGSERYFSIELKEMESKLLVSKDEALKLQMKIYSDLKDYLLIKLIDIQKAAKNIAKIDSISSLTYLALNNNYSRPDFNDKGYIKINKGRHPIVESKFSEEAFVPNDTILDMNDNLIHIITGPNMAGKSTYMRQVALIVIMAHIGSYVPATYANISIVDRVFTRIGASDNLSRGESTFMVEMKEVANIVDSASKKSLIILDEVGRGTSTYDGLSLAWALVEFIVNKLKAKTLFATHYHELVNLSEKYNSITNLTIEVEKQDDNIIFLRKIINGFTNNSYGIEVAKLAGVNKEIVSRANEILDYISNNEDMDIKNNLSKKDKEKVIQKTIFDEKNENFIRKISNININELSPIEALNLLHSIVNEAKEDL